MEFSDEEIGGRNENSGDDGGYRSDEAQEDRSGQNEDEDGEGGQGRRIDPSTSKKKIVRKPQPKLNAERIQGPKGIQTIEKYFEGFKFHGKGHEKSDLNRIMKRLEHWAHRLFPKYRFDDFLEKMEVLGSKKNVQVYLKKYRLDMITPDDDIVEPEDDNAAKRDELPEIEEEPIDEFDKLISEQIEKQRRVTNEPPKQINKPAGYVLGSASTAKPSELSDEVKARIEANRKLAMERKMARLKREEESKKRKLEESQGDSQISTSSEVLGVTGVRIVEDVILRKADEKPRDFGGKESNNFEEERKRKTEDFVEEVMKKKAQDSSEEEMMKKKKAQNFLEEEMKKKKAQDFLEEEMKKKRAQEFLEEEMIKKKLLEEEIPMLETVEEPQRIAEPMESFPEDIQFAKPENVYAVAKDIDEIPMYQYQEYDLPKVNRRDYGESNKEPEKLLTHEELLMEIDGAMEEIINKSTRRST